jgi:hypothetical protein
MSSVSRNLVGAALCAALCVTPAMASAAIQPASVQSINPMVAVSLLGSPASAATLCGAQAAAATAPGSGCVLPVTDLPPPVAQPAPPPPLPAAAAPAGFGIAPLLIGLLGVAALVALLALDGDDDDGEPVSPN